MSALYLDGFDHYGVGTVGYGNMLDGTWAQVMTEPTAGPGVPAWGTRTGLLALKAAGGGVYRYILSSSQSHLFQSFGYSVDGLPLANFQNCIASFRSSGNTEVARLWCQADGSIVLTDQATGTVVASTQGPILTSRSWHFLEMEINTSAGTFKLYVDDATASGTPAITATGLSFVAALGQMGYGQIGGGNSTDAWFDDLFIRNASGTINNGFLGDRRIATMYANADTAISGWTPSYYHRFGAGILTLAFAIPNNASPQNPIAGVATPHTSSLDIGTADFTIETSVRFDQLPGAANFSTIMSEWDTANNARSWRFVLGGSSFNNSCLQFDYTTDGTPGTLVTPIVYPWQPVLNTWYSLALVRVGGELLLFVDGVQLGLPVADTANYFAGVPYTGIGAQIREQSFSPQVDTNTTLCGRLDETRFTNGVGRYTGPYTPSATAFTRGSGDPSWSSVVWLMGYDSGVIDESSFSRVVNSINGATSYIPTDGPAVGVYSTVNKANPDDNTFIAASLINATNIGTMTSQPANGNTVTIGTTDGTTPAVYTFKTSITSAFDVLIDTTAALTLTNLLNAINIGPGGGTKYGAGTTANFDVTGAILPAGQIEVTANLAGTTGNAVPSTHTGTAFTWATTTLTGGQDIPGPTQFYFQHPPNNTTIISALQTVVRALKTDAGTASIQTAFIGPLGGEEDGVVHPLTISPDYYNDIIEVDPDSSGPLSPTSLINGKFQINRTS